MTNTVESPTWLTNDEAAEYIGIAPQTLRQWNSRGKCGGTTDGKIRKPPKAYKRGGKIGYKLPDLEAWLEANSK